MAKPDERRLTPVEMAEMTPEDEGVKPRHENDLRCGVGACRSEGLQRCANMKMYVTVISLQFLLHLSLFTYFMGIARTVERRFGFSTKETGVLGSAGDAIQTVLVLFVGYFGRKTHKPRYLCVSSIICGLGAMMLALPYAIYGPLKYDVSTTNHNNTLAAGAGDHFASPGLNFQTCNGANSSSDSCGDGSSAGAGGMQSNTSAYIIFLFSCVLLSIGGSGLNTLGIAFIDENVKKENSGLYIGVVTSMFSIGPIIGYSLAAVTTTMPEDLTDTTLSPGDPQFIGCWWLGILIIGGLMTVLSLPLFFFPKHFPDYYKYHKVPAKKRRASQVAMSTVKFELKQLPKSIWKMLSDPAFMFLILAKVCAIYFVIGVLMTMPRYLEVHFRQPAFIANIGSAIAGALTGALGNILGGVIMKKAKIQPIGSARFFIMAILVTMAGLAVMMFVSCDQAPVHGQTSPGQRSLEVANECNANCGCDRDLLQPVCSTDGEMYFSPCHAGCQGNGNGTYNDCSCTAQNVTSVSAEFCDKGCKSFIYYMIIFMVMSLIGSMARVPATILMFRLVDEEMKSLALGITSSLFNILVFVPGPVAFGTLYDSTCLIWQSKCGSRGACLIYEVRSFRLYMHGVTLVFQAGALLLSGIMYYFVVKRFSSKRNGPISDTLGVEKEKEAMLALNNKSDDVS